jgi:hypothetical protein
MWPGHVRDADCDSGNDDQAGDEAHERLPAVSLAFPAAHLWRRR